MKDDILRNLKKVKTASHALVNLEESKCNALLESLANQLRNSMKDILLENAKDLENMSPDNPMYDRLQLTEDRLCSMANDLQSLTRLSPELGKKLEEKKLENGLILERVSVPLGVVAVIYESRPNVTTDVFSLCFKARNACVLKGGKEARHTNTILVKIIQETLSENGLSTDIIYLLPSEREATQILLNAIGLVDVCIPRGSQALINFVRENARIPIIETGAGVVHTYFDKTGDLEKGRRIIHNAKTRRVSVCNALDGLIIHEERLDDLFNLIQPLVAQSVEIFSDEKSFAALHSKYPENLLHPATAGDFGREFLSYKMSIKTVASVEAAVEHIMQHTSGHSEAIIAENEKTIAYFISNVDAAVVYINASTAFTDGGQFGMGAEIGISTQKLHARGPMALKALSAYKWIVHGQGQIR